MEMTQLARKLEPTENYTLIHDYLREGEQENNTVSLRGRDQIADIVDQFVQDIRTEIENKVAQPSLV